jgi:hypothetical protein
MTTSQPLEGLAEWLLDRADSIAGHGDSTQSDLRRWASEVEAITAQGSRAPATAPGSVEELMAAVNDYGIRQFNAGRNRPHASLKGGWDDVRAVASRLAAPAGEPTTSARQLTYEEAREIAFRAAKAFRPSYFTGDDFEPHQWVVHAVISGTTPGQILAAKGSDMFSRAAATQPAGAAPQPTDEALKYATDLARSIWVRHYKEVAPKWEPFTDIMGVLSQIDNMLTGWREAGAAPQPLTDGLTPAGLPRQRGRANC